MKSFTKSFTQQEPIPDAAIESAVAVLRSGRLHRYNQAEGETSEASLLEKEFADYQGSRYCLACTSGGYAIQVALRAAGLKPGDAILANAYTLAPVPGAIHNAGGRPIFVEIDENYHIDLADLEAKAEASGARFLLLSHMRGHIAEMDAIEAFCRAREIILIEDCAHTMGALWDGRRSGQFGKVACFSAQTYKHINSGEGGFIITDDPLLAAKAVVHSGSYMLYERHGAAPPPEVFEEIRYETANMSGRMDNLRAAILRPQLAALGTSVERWNARYRTLEAGLRAVPGLRLPERDSRESYVGSSIQFFAAGLEESALPDLVTACAARGVEIKWFGEAEPRAFTSRYDSWRYIEDLPHLPRTLSVLAKTCDLRIPLTFELEDCALIAEIIGEEVKRLAGREAA